MRCARRRSGGRGGGLSGGGGPGPLTPGGGGPAGRPDPIAVLERQAGERVPDLVPIRYGRMVESPFAYYRGAAAPMAWDLAHTPTTDIMVQCCGDAHLMNFGMF